jgi:hypothetical protein
MTESITVENVKDFIDAVGDTAAASTQRKKDRSLWFRGQNNAYWDVQAALWRRDCSVAYTTGDERNLTHRFRTRAASRRTPTHTYGDHAAWLSLMQHYGLPTRLLDWSRSPLIAAFFAVHKYLDPSTVKSSDAAIWVLSPTGLNERTINHSVTPALESKMCRHLVIPAFRDLDSPRERDRALNKGPILAAMATETDMRMFVQQGCFTVHSPHMKPMQDSEILQGILWKYVIPEARVRAFAQDLDMLGFRQGDLFPDLQNLAGDLKLAYPARSFPDLPG